MFSVYLRAAITFLATPILLWVQLQAMNPIIDVVTSFGVQDSPLEGYMTATLEWLPLVILLSLVFWVVSAAIVQRQAAGGI